MKHAAIEQAFVNFEQILGKYHNKNAEMDREWELISE